jgi:tol-pal system protein YbgF
MLRSILAIVALVGLGLSGPAAAQGTGSADNQERRLQRLEEQMVDLSAQIGTIESVTHGSGGGPASGGGGGDDAQMRSLSSQMNDLMRRLERLEARLGMAAPSPHGSNYGDGRPRDSNDRQGRARPAENGTGFSIGGLDDQNDGNDQPSASPPPLQQRGNSAATGGNYASDTRGTYPSDARSGGYSADTPRSERGGWATEPAPLPPQTAPGPRTETGSSLRVAALSSPQAQAAYDQAYGAFQQQNFRAASTGFEQFLQRYPADPLAGSASFWLGEAAFSSGEYRKAADMYLKTATNYPENEKAAESMLKLGISLKRLGENDAACSTFSELGKRYPSASALLQRAETEKRRSSC